MKRVDLIAFDAQGPVTVAVRASCANSGFQVTVGPATDPERYAESGWAPVPMQRVGSADAINKAEFHSRLRAWLGGTNEVIVGSSDAAGVTPWVYVQDGGWRFR